MSLLLLFVHGEKIGQEKLDRRGCVQKHSREEYTAQSAVRIRRQGMDRVTGLCKIDLIYFNAMMKFIL